MWCPRLGASQVPSGTCWPREQELGQLPHKLTPKIKHTALELDLMGCCTTYRVEEYGKYLSLTLSILSILTKKRFLALAVGMVQLSEGAGPLMWKCQYQPTSAQKKTPDKRHGSSRDVCTLLQWQPRVTEITLHNRARRHMEIWNPHRDITDSTLDLIHPQATAQVSLPSAKLEQYTFSPPKFDIRGGIYITFIFPRRSLQQHSWKYLLSYTSCTVFESYFPKKLSLHGFSLCLFLCVLACLNLFSQNWPMVDQLWHMSWI